MIPFLVPLIAQGLGGSMLSYGANLYSQQAQRDVLRNQMRGYERQLSDWNKNVGSKTGRSIRYPELSFPGQIYSAQKGVSQSYASGVASTGQFLRSSSMYGSIYAKSAGLFDKQEFGSHRWL